MHQPIKTGMISGFSEDVSPDRFAFLDVSLLGILIERRGKVPSGRESTFVLGRWGMSLELQVAHSE